MKKLINWRKRIFLLALYILASKCDIILYFLISDTNVTIKNIKTFRAWWFRPVRGETITLAFQATSPLKHGKIFSMTHVYTVFFHKEANRNNFRGAWPPHCPPGANLHGGRVDQQAYYEIHWFWCVTCHNVNFSRGIW